MRLAYSRLCRLMSGKAVPFQEPSPHFIAGSAREFGRSPINTATACHGKSETRRISGGTAAKNVLWVVEYFCVDEQKSQATTKL
jgi:hypothetical protein